MPANDRMTNRRPRAGRGLASIACAFSTALAAATLVLRVLDVPMLTVRLNDDTTARLIKDSELYGTAGARMGDARARVAIVLFSDFTCPACGIAAARFRDARLRHPTELAVVYRHIPLNDRAHGAAVVAECGRRAGRFEEVHDALFRDANALGARNWWSYGKEAGLSDSVAFSPLPFKR
ncbi:MAG: thioredoxin domain-containing protein [Gemmatimonadetes bacterium]|nr:thioredoxin domain-containing protein [Gemmatimonadota bacterium]